MTVQIAATVRALFRDVEVPCERGEPRDHDDCPSDELVREFPTEVRKWSLAKKIKRDEKERQG